MGGIRHRLRDATDPSRALRACRLAQPIDLVVTVCDDARETCPDFPGARRTEHWSLEDPSRASGTDEERLAVYRRVRDQISAHADALIAGDDPA